MSIAVVYSIEAAESIDTSDKTIFLNNGGKLNYDRLIIAAGAYSFVPPFPGSDSEGVFTLRTIADADRIIEFAKDKKQAAIFWPVLNQTYIKC